MNPHPDKTKIHCFENLQLNRLIQEEISFQSRGLTEDGG